MNYLVVAKGLDHGGDLFFEAHGTGTYLCAGRFTPRRRLLYPIAKGMGTGGLLLQSKIQADRHRQRERKRHAQRYDEPFVIPFLFHCHFLREGY